MSSAQDEMDRRTELAGTANDIALKASAIRECPNHERSFINRRDPAAVQAAEAAGRRLQKKQLTQYDLDELLAAIRFAIDGAPDRCPLCPGESD